jgi:hypothetical protein
MQALPVLHRGKDEGNVGTVSEGFMVSKIYEDAHAILEGKTNLVWAKEVLKLVENAACGGHQKDSGRDVGCGSEKSGCGEQPDVDASDVHGGCFCNRD